MEGATPGEEALPALTMAMGRRSVSPSGDDRKLIRAAARGSPDAVENLVRRYWPTAHRTAVLIVQDAAAAEDIAQESLLSALAALDRFNARKPLAPWIHRIVTNRALDHLRARRRRGETELEESFIPRQSVLPPDGSLELSAALRTLKPEARAIVVLRHTLDYRSNEIGDMLGMPASTVRWICPAIDFPEARVAGGEFCWAVGSGPGPVGLSAMSFGLPTRPDQRPPEPLWGEIGPEVASVRVVFEPPGAKARDVETTVAYLAGSLQKQVGADHPMGVFVAFPPLPPDATNWEDLAGYHLTVIAYDEEGNEIEREDVFRGLSSYTSRSAGLEERAMRAYKGSSR